jgi:hypothetical protein
MRAAKTLGEGEFMRIIIDGQSLPGNVKTSRDLLVTLRNIAKV